MKLSLAISLIISSILISRAGAAPLSPDERKENKFHSLFSKLNESPTDDEAWKSALSQGNTQNYTVESGDTLWGISETLFGDPQFYPKIWSLNGDDVFNPHEILPQQVIQFTEGTLGEAPQLAVKAGVDEAGAEMATAATAEPALEPDGNVDPAELPQALVKSHKARKLPASLPEWNLSRGAVSSYILELRDSQPLSLNADSFLGFALADKDLISEGEVTETEMNMKSAAEQHMIFVKMKSTPTQSRFIVVRNGGEVADPYRQRKGILIEYQGEIELQQLVNPKENIYRAQVRHSLAHVQVGSHLMSGELPVLNPMGESAAVNHASQVIGGQFGTDRKIFGKDDVIFLNSGQTEGLAVGQSLPIYKNQISRNKKTQAVENPRPIAQAKIVKLSNDFATAIVTSSVEEIHIGDSTDPSSPVAR